MNTDTRCVHNHAEGFLCRMDSLRANLMRHYLNDEGCKHIWLYDVGSPRNALLEARYDQNYDNIAAYDSKAAFAFTGAGIEDVYGRTAWDLRRSVRWLCTVGYLSCYKKT